MEKFRYARWTDIKETFIKVSGRISRDSEIKSDFFIIPVEQLKKSVCQEEISKLMISKN